MRLLTKAVRMFTSHGGRHAALNRGTCTQRARRVSRCRAVTVGTMATAERRAAVHDGHVPSPPSERRAWMLACGLALLGAGVLVALLTGAVGRSTAPAVVRVTPPAVPAVAPAPLAPTTLAGALSSGQSRGAAERAAIVGQHSRAEQARDEQRFIDQTQT